MHQRDDDTPMNHRGEAPDDNEPCDPSHGVRCEPVGEHASGALHCASPADLAKTICICVDDVGMNHGINRAAMQLVAQQRVHALSCMVGAPAWPAAGVWLRQLKLDEVDVGLHLDLTEFPQLARLRTSLPSLIAGSFRSALDRDRLRREICAQLDRFEQSLGRGPAFVDGHQHVHQLPGVRDELARALAERHGGLKPWLRSTRHRVVAGTGWLSAAKAWGVARLGSHGLAALAADYHLQQNKCLLGLYDFRGGETRYRVLVSRWLYAARCGDLLVCHPSAPVASNEPLLRARTAEFAVLSNPEFAELLRACHVAVSPMSKIVMRSGAEV